MVVYLVVTAASLWLMLKLSEHVELRAGRWIQITLSLPIVLALTSIVRLPNEAIKPLIMPAVVLLLLVVAIWRGNIAFLIAVGVTNTIVGSTHKLTGFAPDYSYAQRAMKNGEFEDAVELIETELEKDLGHYEGLCMLFQCLHALDKLGDAAAVLEHAAAQDYSPAQKQLLERELHETRIALFNSRQTPEPLLLSKSKVFRKMLAARPAREPLPGV